MSVQKSKSQLHEHRSYAIQKIDDYLNSLIECDDPKMNGKADKLSYWLEDWTTFLGFEPQFSPRSLRRYKRGEIIKVHLGFNVGSEEGGLHYAVVLDKNNPKSSPVVTIAPLTSVKPQTNIANLKPGSVFLGNELFTNLSSKISTTYRHAVEEISLLRQLIDDISEATPPEEQEALKARVDAADKEADLFVRMRSEISKMKHGSIALVNQITTVSKIRIYDPKTDHDILSNIKLSNEKLDLIDKEIIKKLTNM